MKLEIPKYVLYFDFGMGGSYSYFVCKMGVGVGYWGVVGFEMAVLV